MSTYIVSDIHGHLREFNKMLNEIKYDSFKEDDHLYILGDAIDKGPDSIQLLLKIMDMVDTKKCTYLLGNHDHMFYDYILFSKGDISDYKAGTWTKKNQGQATWDQYQALSDKDKNRISDFLLNAPLIIPDLVVNNRHYCLCHSAPIITNKIVSMKDLGTSYEDVKNIVWSRPNDYWFNFALPLGDDKVTIGGHTYTYDCKFLYIYDLNYLDIDCGCAIDGNLGYLLLDKFDPNNFDKNGPAVKYIKCQSDS